MPGDIQGIVGIMRVWSEGSGRRATVGMSLYSIMLFSVRMKIKVDLGLASLNYFREPRSTVGFPCGSASKESACNVGDLGSIPELRRSPGEGKGYPLQYSGLENSMDCIVHGVAKSWTQLSNFHFHWGIVAVVSGLVLLPGAIKKEQVARCENSNKEGG